MARKRKKELLIRRWLNKVGHHSTAFVYVQHSGRWGSLAISDCGRQISLDIDASNAKSKANTIHKLRELERAVREVREFVEAHGSEDSSDD